MATELTKQAEAAIHGFYRASDALESLGKLYETTHAAVDKSQPGPRVVDVTQTILDMAVQKVVEHLSWRLLQESDATPASVGLPELLDLCIDGIAHKYLIVSAAYKVLEDVMEAQTISTCEKMWDLVEERKDKLSTRDIHSETGRPTKAALCLLRMCNALLRRVSKTHNSVFCGRILVFLSFTFALSERSAVNLTGKPNVSNSTTFEDEEAFEAAEAAEEVAAATAVQLDKDSTTDGVPIDYNLYRTFWDLQRFCREHNLAIKSVDDWEKFNEELNTVLSAFEGNAFSPDDLERTRDLLTSATSSTISGDTDEEMSSPTTVQDHFFQPKYLTNSRLFRLQLRDPILRECMLTQFLILLNHLAKAKQPDGCKTPKSRLQELSDRVVKLIRETPPSGKRFSEMLDLVLERERNWVKWKQEKCPSYERSPPPKEASMPKKRRMGDMPALSSRAPLPKRGKHQDSGDSSLMEQILTESSKPSAILERIRGQDRATAVPMEKFTERFAEAWDPENGIEEAYWPDKDKMFCWRTLRMAMKTNVVHMHLAASGTGAVVKAILGLPAATPAKETPEQGENATAKDEADRMKQEAASEIKS